MLQLVQSWLSLCWLVEQQLFGNGCAIISALKGVGVSVGVLSGILQLLAAK